LTKRETEQNHDHYHWFKKHNHSLIQREAEQFLHLFSDAKNINSSSVLGKRPYHMIKQENEEIGTIAPNKIFKGISSFLPLERQKLVASTEFLNFSNDSTCFVMNDINEICDKQQNTVHEQQYIKSPKIKKSKLKKEKIQNENIVNIPSSAELHTNKNNNTNLIDVNVTFGIRGNGNQPWKQSRLAPPKIGKMRKITIDVNSNSNSVIPIQIRVRAEDIQKNLHKGKLVFCRDDRCCVKSKVPGRSKQNITCKAHERNSTLYLPKTNISSSTPCSFDLFLKPEWNGLGKNKIRPSFQVFIEAIDCNTQTVYPILTWETELQSHKFESSRKAKSMESIKTSSSRITLAI